MDHATSINQFMNKCTSSGTVPVQKPDIQTLRTSVFKRIAAHRANKNSGKSLGFDQFLRAKELRTKVKCLYDLLAKNPLVLGRMCPFSSDNCFQARNEKLLSSYLLCLGRVALLVSHRVCMCLPHRLKFTVYLILTKQLSHIASYCTICGGTQQDLHGNGMFNHLDTTSNPTKETIAQLQVWTTVRVVVTSGLLTQSQHICAAMISVWEWVLNVAILFLHLQSCLWLES